MLLQAVLLLSKAGHFLGRDYATFCVDVDYCADALTAVGWARLSSKRSIQLRETAGLREHSVIRIDRPDGASRQPVGLHLWRTCRRLRRRVVHVRSRAGLLLVSTREQHSYSGVLNSGFGAPRQHLGSIPVLAQGYNGANNRD